MTLSVLLLLVFATSGLGFLFPVSPATAALGVFAAVFVYGKLVIAFHYLQGHGIFRRGGWRGIPTFLLAILGLLGVLILGMVYISWFGDSGLMMETVWNFRFLTTAFMLGYGAAILSWFLWLYSKTFYGSEYDARVQLAAQGDWPEVVKIKIKKLQRKEVFGPQD